MFKCLCTYVIPKKYEVEETKSKADDITSYYLFKPMPMIVQPKEILH